MDTFPENKDMGGENTDTSDQITTDAQAESGKGFAEKQAIGAEQPQQAIPPQQQKQPNIFGEQSYNYSGYNQPQPPYYGYAPQNPYAGMYGNSQYGQPNGQPNRPTHPAPPTPPPVSPASDLNPAEKKPHKGWIIAIAVIVVAVAAAIMLLLASNNDNSYSDSSSAQQSTDGSASNVSITLPVKNKPAVDESLYADEETGLFTSEGAVEYAQAPIVNLYTYGSTVIAPTSSGSGIIISDDGYILTNAHIVSGNTRFKAKLSDEREFEATVIGSDTSTDIAVLKIDAEDLTSADIGVSSELKRGEQVIAIGNAGGYTDSVSSGCVSYVHRQINSYTGYPITCVQTDACLNFGNSGGALINMYGQVVGMVTSKYSSTGSENIGFAIASDFFVPIVEDIISQGYVGGRARVGITYMLIDAESAAALGIKPGLRVATIAEDCDISNTELQVDDIITEIDGIQMLTTSAVNEFLNSKSPGDVVTAKVYRKSITDEETKFEITFTLMENTTSSN